MHNVRYYLVFQIRNQKNEQILIQDFNNWIILLLQKVKASSQNLDFRNTETAMSDNLEQKTQLLPKMSKKSSKKGASQIPLDALGFRPKVFYDTIHQYVPRRKANKNAKYQKQKRQMNFKSKLSCIIDPSHATYEQIGDMKFNNRSEWKKIKFIIYRTKQLLTCCICLNKKFIAPQMTFCGHVFCWHCILMHYEKSLKANYCPFCNEVFQIQELKTCDTLFLPPISQGQKIRFNLKLRNPDQQITFNPSNLQQQTQFSHIIRMKNEKILEKYTSQQQEILTQMKVNDDVQTQRYLNKVLNKSQQKINQLKESFHQQKSHHHSKLGKHKMFKNGVLCQILPPEEVEKMMTFYQQDEGRYVFLHPICEKYLRKNFQSLPFAILQQIIYKEETEYSGQNIRKYKYLNHLPDNQDFDFVFIKMNSLIDYRLLQQFQRQFESYKKKQQQISQKQEEFARLLNQKYQKEQEYLRQLKKMEQQQFHDIKVPTSMLDMKEILDTQIFPSLVQTISQQSSVDTNKKSQAQCVFGAEKKKKQKKSQFTLKEQDFPGLQLAMKMSLEQSEIEINEIQQHIQRKLSADPSLIKQPILKKQLFQNDFPDLENSPKSRQQTVKSKKKQDDSQENKGSKRKGKKKNKEKFIDVTAQFFQRQQDDD